MNFKTLINIFILFISSLQVSAQLLDNCSFKIYRAFVLGSITEIKLNSDNTYDQYITEFNCSLCDNIELQSLINESGKWIQKNDTIFLNGKRKLYIKSKNELVNLTLFDTLTLFNTVNDSISTEEYERIKRILIEAHPTLFRLVYDTYKNGVVRSVIDRYRGRRNEYEIKFTENGEVISVNYFWDDKIRKRIKE